MLPRRAVAVLLAAALLAGCSGGAAPEEQDPAPARAAPRPAPRPPVLVRDGAPAQVRVLQYNVQFADAGLDGVARDIRESGADIVLLNEVDDRRSTGGPLQAAYLARRLGMSYAYDPNGEVSSGLRGNAVLTTFDIAYVRRYRLPQPDGTERRGLMNVVVTGGDVQLDVWTTHLNPDVGTLAQARRVRTVVGVPRCTTVVAGDLNVKPYRNPPQVVGDHLRDVWRAVGEGPGGTNSSGTRRIDYLFSARATPLAAEVLERRHSDHRGLLGTFRMDPRDNC